MNASRHVACPCHACNPTGPVSALAQGARHIAKTVQQPKDKEYAFEIAAANLRFGEGVTKEVGMDFANMKARKVGVFTDKNVEQLLPMKMVRCMTRTSVLCGLKVMLPFRREKVWRPVVLPSKCSTTSP